MSTKKCKIFAKNFQIKCTVSLGHDKIYLKQNIKEGKMVHILIVEDDKNIAQMIAITISIVDYKTTVCNDGNKAFELIMNNHYDLILLDVMLPGISGFSLIQKIKGRNTPIIFLSALQNVSDIVKGLRLGAEDYIVKPFEAVELLARIDVVLRRTNKGVNMLFYEDLTINIEEHTIKKGFKNISLTPKEFDLLVFFIKNTDIVLSRERLLAAIWGYTYQGESRTVDTHVQQVRRKAGLHGKLISVPKLGYRLNKNTE